MDFETVIGLEAHIQLSTSSKIFSGASAAFGGEPNSHIDVVTAGLPGALPVVNKAVVDYAIMMGLATDCEIRRFNRFARKHYFYPDLPKGYQISQHDEPICERGKVTIAVGESIRTIGITRIHMEEDAGKNMHETALSCSLIDLNRAGVPLLEVVSEPDLRSPTEASAYLKVLRQLVRYLGISDGNMEEGSLRCDANISLRPVGELRFGTRTEVKNINSFRFVEKAIEYEVARQMKILRNGGQITQETRLFDSETGVTKPMRGKEESADYRYLPDPDLPPLVINESWIQEIRLRAPKLPSAYITEFMQHGLTFYDASVLTAEQASALYFEEVYAVCKNAKLACNWITSELFGALNRKGVTIEASPISATALGELVTLIAEDVVSGKMAKLVFEEMLETGKDATQIVNEKGLRQITDQGHLSSIIEQVINDHPKQLSEYLAGEAKVHGFFVGQVMKVSKGSANPKKVNELLQEALTKRKE